jgi:hypothetical protein
MIYPRYWLVLCGVADVKIFLEKKGSGNKPHAEESAFRQYHRSTHTDKIKLTMWNSSSKEKVSRNELRKQLQVVQGGKLSRYFIKYKMFPQRLSSSKSDNHEEITVVISFLSDVIIREEVRHCEKVIFLCFVSGILEFQQSLRA